MVSNTTKVGVLRKCERIAAKNVTSCDKQIIAHLAKMPRHPNDHKNQRSSGKI